MSHYQKPKRIKITLWLMVIGLIVTTLLSAIAGLLPSASDDINEMAATLDTGTVEEVVIDTGVQIAPDSILNQFQT
jgi:hypothetical protein